MDPQTRPAEFSSAVLRVRWAGDPIGLRRRTTLFSRVHFPQAERQDRFPSGQKASRKIGCPLAGNCYRLGCPDPLGDRGAAAVVVPLRSPVEFDCWGLGNRVRRPLFRDGRGGPGSTGSLANWSALHPTRLETRTKESNMRASR